MKMSEIGIFFREESDFHHPGAENRTRGDFLKIGRPADDAARQVGGTMAARPFKCRFVDPGQGAAMPWPSCTAALWGSYPTRLGQ